MKKIITLFLVCGLVSLFNPINASNRWFVDASKPDDSGDGSSWGTAKKTIEAAVTASGAWDTIMVKGGNYTFSAPWIVTSQKQYYGGFAGNETYAKTKRSLTDLDGNGIIEAWEFSNATILNFTNVNDNAITLPNSNIQFDGFTITHTGTLAQTKRTVTCANATANFINNTIKDCNITVSMSSASTGATILRALGNVSNCLIQNNIVSVNATNDGNVNLVEVATTITLPGTKLLNSVVRNNKMLLNYAGGSSNNGNARGIIVYVAPSATASTFSVLHGCLIHNNEITFTGNSTYPTMSNGSFVTANNLTSSVGDTISNCVIANNKGNATSGYTFNTTGLKLFCSNNTPHFANNNVCWNNTNSAGAISNIATNGTVAAGNLSYNFANGGSLTNGGSYISNNDANLSSINIGSNAPYFVLPTTTIGNTTDNSAETSVWSIFSSSYLKGKGTTTSRTLDKADVSFASIRSVGAYEFVKYFQSNGNGNWSGTNIWQTSPDGSTWSSTLSNPSRTYAEETKIQPSHLITTSSNATASSLTVNPGGKLTLESGKTLTTNSLTLQSNTTSAATFLNSGTLNATTVTAQQEIPVARNWYMSSPVTGAAALPTVNTGTLTFYAYPENDALQAAGGNGYAAGAVWNTISAGTFETGKGYIVRPSAANATVSFTGTSFNTGDKTISGMSYTAANPKKGFHLIGNPYPSYLNVLPSINANANLETTVWYRTRDTNQTPYYHNETVNTTSGVGTNASGTGRVTGFIPPMQSFWVRTTADNQSIILQNTNRSHATSVNMTGIGSVPTTALKAPKADSPQYSLLGLYVSNGNTGDETILMFAPEAADNLDAYDSKKLSNQNASIPEIYTTTESEQLAINGLRNIPEAGISLGFTTGKAGNFKIKASEISNFNNNTEIYLRDKQENTEVVLTAATEYNFSSDITSNNENRFSILFKSPGVTTGIDNQQHEKFSVFVNTQGQLVILSGENSSYAVYNAAGQIVNSGKTTGKATTTGFLPKGLYVVRINNQTAKIIL
jgi:hypothetical protein